MSCVIIFMSGVMFVPCTTPFELSKGRSPMWKLNEIEISAFYISTSLHLQASMFPISVKVCSALETIYLNYRKRCLNIMAIGLLTFECYHSDMEMKPTRR